MTALNDALRESTHFHVDGQHATLSLSLQVGVLENGEREREREVGGRGSLPPP